MVVTRKKIIDTKQLLGLSSRSRQIQKKSKNVKDVDRKDSSGKENEVNKRSLRSKEKSVQEKTTPLKLRQDGDSPKSTQKKKEEPLVKRSLMKPRFTSTPHPRNTRKKLPKLSDEVIISDSDVTDSELSSSPKPCTTKILEHTETTRPKRTVRKPQKYQTQNKIFMTHRFDQPNCSKMALSFNKKGDPLINVMSRKVIISPSKEKSSLQTQKVKQNKRMKERNEIKSVPEERKIQKKLASKERMKSDDESQKSNEIISKINKEDSTAAATVSRVPKYKQALCQLTRKSSVVMVDRDVYDFPSSQDSQKSADSQDSFMKKLIEKVKKKRVRKPRKPKEKVKKLNTSNSVKTAEQNDGNTQKEVPTEPVIVKTNKAFEVMNKIRDRLREKNCNTESSAPIVQQSVDVEMNYEANQSNLEATKNNSMLNQSLFDPSVDSPQLVPAVPSSRKKIITDPKPSTSTGGWTVPSKSTTIPHSNFNDKNASLHNFSSFKRLDVSNQTLSPFDQTKNRSNQSYKHHRLAKAMSPWRVANEERIPRSTYFSLSKDLLPSYASDVIVDDRSHHTTKKSSVSFVEDQSLNNSDMENIAPRTDASNKKTVKNLPRPMTNRIPLQAIAIDQEDTLNLTNNTSVKESPLVKHSLTRREIEAGHKIQVLSNVSLPTNKYQFIRGQLIRNSISNRSASNDPKAHQEKSSDLSDNFGFDDPTNNDTIELPSHEITETDLKQRLKELRRLCPLEKSNSSSHDMPTLFKSPLKQTRPLMSLFATKVNQENASTPVVLNNKVKKMHHYEDDEVEFNCEISTDEDQDISVIQTETQNGTNTDTLAIPLFDDPKDEIQITQFPEAHRRSYLGRHKRKRLNFSDYETSDDEFDENQDAAKKRPNKKKKVNVENTKEFKKFVDEFTSMCDEVDDYELVVE